MDVSLSQTLSRIISNVNWLKSLQSNKKDFNTETNGICSLGVKLGTNLNQKIKIPTCANLKSLLNRHDQSFLIQFMSLFESKNEKMHPGD